MDDPFWQVRVKAAASLGTIGAVAAIPTLGTALTHAISNVRKEAATALGTIGDASARPLLLPFTNDADPDVRKAVRWALSRCS